LGPVATAGYRYRTPAVAAVTAVYRAVTNGKKNPDKPTGWFFRKQAFSGKKYTG
jgi:hypothetical protein